MANMNPEDAMQLADWRRQTAELFARVREQADPAVAHALWRDGRDQMMRSHPQSPLPLGDPMRARGVPYWPYDPALRWTVPVEQLLQPQRLVIDTGLDGVTTLRAGRLGHVRGSSPARSAVVAGSVWWRPVPAAAGRDGGHHQLRRRPVPARHGEGRRSRLGRTGARYRPEFPVPPVLPLRQPLGLPARATQQRHRRTHSGGRAANPAVSPGEDAKSSKIAGKGT